MTSIDIPDLSIWVSLPRRGGGVNWKLDYSAMFSVQLQAWQAVILAYTFPNNVLRL